LCQSDSSVCFVFRLSPIHHSHQMWKTAIKQYNKLKTNGIIPSINTFVTLLKKTTTQQEIIELENY